MKIEPVTYRIVVKPHDITEEDEAYRSAKKLGIQIAGNDIKREQEGVDMGTVLSMGPVAFEAFNTPNPLKVGDTIIYARFGGKKVKDPETKEEFLILNDEDVIAILSKETR